MNLDLAPCRESQGPEWGSWDDGMTVISSSLALPGLDLCRWVAIARWDLVVLPSDLHHASTLPPAGEWERRGSGGLEDAARATARRAEQVHLDRIEGPKRHRCCQ